MPVRFNHADDVAIRAEVRRHHIVSERRDDVAGESEVLCSCGLSVKLPKAESALDGWTEHFLAALKGSAA